MTPWICAALALPAAWFAQALIERIPDRLPLLRPPVAPPVHGRGRLVAAAVMLLFVGAGLRFPDQPWQLAGALVLFCSLVALTFIDIDHQRLPDRITAPTYVVLLGIVVAGSLAERQPAQIRWALLGAAIYVVGLGLGWLIGMGFGDVKAGGVMGLYLGFVASSAVHAVSLALWALIIGTATASVYGLVARGLQRRRDPGDRERQWFAFGPFLALGVAVVVLLGPVVVPPR